MDMERVQYLKIEMDSVTLHEHVHGLNDRLAVHEHG